MKNIRLRLGRKSKKNSNNKKLTIMFRVAFLSFLFINLGFSAYTDKLQIESMATIEGRIYDLVRIQKVSISEVGGGSSSAYYGHKDAEMSATAYVENNSYIIYKVDLINESPYNAYVTNADIVNFTNESGVTSKNHSYEIIDLKESETIIPMHGTYSFYIKVTGTGIINMKFNFQYSLYKYFDLTININPNDADITMTTTEGTYTGTGTVKHRVKEGSTVTYSGSKKYYYTKEETYVMPYGDQTIDLTLEPDPHRIITFNTNPEDASVIVTVDGQAVLPTEPNGKSFSIEVGKTLNYTVVREEYYDSTGTGTVYEDGPLNVTLTPLPPTQLVKALNTNRGSATTGNVTAQYTGKYLIEAWGGKGGVGYDNTTGGAPGYIYGIFDINAGEKIYYTVGGNGVDKTKTAAGGANGGGNGAGAGSGEGSTPGGGGGYSAVTIGTNSITLDTIGSGNVLAIAAGGGGAGGEGVNIGTNVAGKGGNGGSLTTTNSTISAGIVFNGVDGTSQGDFWGNSGTTKGAGGGGSTVGGEARNTGQPGTFLHGGVGNERGGGGGAGYYGGAGGGGNNLLFDKHYGPGGGGGGSSFLKKGVMYQNLPSVATNCLINTNPSSTGGTVVITYMGKNM